MSKTLRELAEKAKKFYFNKHRLSEFQWEASPDAILALLDERDALKTDAARYRAIRSGLEVDENSGIVVSLIDDFGGSTLRNEHADESIDAAMEPSHEL